MDKIINWLMQPTSNGATLLQAIIMTAILFFLFWLMFKMIEDIIPIAKDALKEEAEKDVDSEKV